MTNRRFLVLVKDQEILKIHIHTNKPGQV
ncbi:hypothetical protein ACEW7V_00690 [Areca yellow leaf disease phytoplasma]